MEHFDNIPTLLPNGQIKIFRNLYHGHRMPIDCDHRPDEAQRVKED